jgi:hypothetical protein
MARDAFHIKGLFASINVNRITCGARRKRAAGKKRRKKE